MGFLEKRLDNIWELLWRPAVIAALSFIILLGFFLQSNGADPDLFARLAVGRLIELYNGVVVKDPFAFTPRLPVWIDHEWLAGHVFYQVLQLAGPLGLFIFKCVLVLMSLLWLARACSVQGGRSRVHPVAFLVISFSCMYLWSSTVRSQIFTYLFLPYSLFAFSVHEKEGRWAPLLLIVFLMPVWSNTHGGFVVGLGLFGLYVLSLFVQGNKGWKVAALIFLLALATTCITPYGAETYWRYILHAVTMKRGGIIEWNVLVPWSLSAVIPNLLVLLLVAGWFRLPHTAGPTGICLTLAAAIYGYRHLRLIGIFFMVALVYGTPLLLSLSEKFPVKYSGLLRRSTVIALPILLIIHGTVLYSSFDKKAVAVNSYPVAVTDWLWDNAAPGNILVDFNNGSFVLWRLHPRFLISIDGRYEEVYPPETVGLAAAAITPGSKNFARSLTKINPDYIILPSLDELYLRQYNSHGYCRMLSSNGFSLLARKGSCRRGVKTMPVASNVWEPRF